MGWDGLAFYPSFGSRLVEKGKAIGRTSAWALLAGQSQSQFLSKCRGAIGQRSLLRRALVPQAGAWRWFGTSRKIALLKERSNDPTVERSDKNPTCVRSWHGEIIQPRGRQCRPKPDGRPGPVLFPAKPAPLTDGRKEESTSQYFEADGGPWGHVTDTSGAAPTRRRACQDRAAGNDCSDAKCTGPNALAAPKKNRAPAKHNRIRALQ
ncbi:hypothetical protein PG984_005229 [Apiospora sp. TS-2023a]